MSHRTIMIEALEDRRLLSGSATVGADGTLMVTGTRRADEILVWSGTTSNVQDGSVHVMINGQETVFEANANISRIRVHGGRGADYVRLAAGQFTRLPEFPPGGPIPAIFIPWTNLPATLLGGRGNDTLMGGRGDDSIHGGGGADAIDGYLGNDTLLGGANGDFLVGNLGDDLMIGGKGNDVLDGYAGNDDVRGNLGDDVVRGHEGNDSVNGGRGVDEVFGHEGADLFYGTDDEAERKDVGAGDAIQLSARR